MPRGNGNAIVYTRERAFGSIEWQRLHSQFWLKSILNQAPMSPYAAILIIGTKKRERRVARAFERGLNYFPMREFEVFALEA